MENKMKAAYLPGNSTVEIKEVHVPEPGPGEVLIKTKSSTICGSDIRAIYREHLGKGPEAYQNKIAGHEPAGQIVKCGPGMKRFKTYTDGAQVACGFGTVYEGLEKIGVNGNHQVLVVGLGPVGLAALMLAKALGATMVVGVDAIQQRCTIAKDLGLTDHVFVSGPDTLEKVRAVTDGGKGFERTADCSGHTLGRQLAIRATRQWGKMVMIGEGGTVEFNPSPDIIHDQISIHGSWVTNIWRMEELVERLARWGIHPEDLVTHRFTLDHVSEAYQLMDGGKCGKVAVVYDEEVK
ncbi:MAG: zinc-binding dehydrogenase [Bacteroidales bacterium]|nr:zinc-binding dehydrogenase [Bacteroidales bacterium]